MRPEYIIIHHSLTKDSQTVSWNAIRNYHLSLGWHDIGYHFGIELIDFTYEIFVGRMMLESGAHCKQAAMNYRSIGICCVGNFDLGPVPVAQFRKLVALTQTLMAVFNINSFKVRPHREYATYKTCPGSKFQWDEFKDAIDA